MAADVGHLIAAEMAGYLVKRCLQAGIGWSEMCVALETTIAIVVVTAARESRHPDPVRFATEVINTATEQALTRAVEILK